MLQRFARTFSVAFGLLLFLPRVGFAATSSIAINEIGAFEPTGHEWIEIIHSGSDSVDLTGWIFLEQNTNHALSLVSGQNMTLAPGAFAVIAQDAATFLVDYPGVTATVFDSSWGTLNESGELIGIKDSTGTVIEQFTYISAENFSLERVSASSADFTAANWKEHGTLHSAGSANAASQSASESSSTDTSTTTPATNSLLTIRINEFVADPPEGGSEWIELVNLGASSVSLSGSTLEDGVGQIAALSGDISAGGFFSVTLTTNKLNNGGDIIIFRDATGAIIDQVAFGSWDDGDPTNNAPAPSKGKTVIRLPDGADTNSDAVDWKETETQTQGSSNIFTGTTSQEVSSSPPSSGGGSSSFFLGEVIINELVADPSDDGVEFVELLNTTNQTIVLTNAWIEDGSETRTLLSGTIQPNGFFVIENPKGALNNGGDMAVLFNANGTEMDRVTYGGWNDGNVADNAPAPKDPFALARSAGSLDSNNDLFDFFLTGTITKGALNVVSSLVPNNTFSPFLGNQEIVVNEVFPNPDGSDLSDEFIELLNVGGAARDVGGWKLRDESDTTFFIPAKTIVQPKGILLFSRKTTGIALNNTGGDTIELLDSFDAVHAQLLYVDAAPEGESFARREDGRFVWTASSTPGLANIITGRSAAPLISITAPRRVSVDEPTEFDASDTIDAEGGLLDFVWDFGDRTTSTGDVVEHIFSTEGVYAVRLTVTDAEGNHAEQTVSVTVFSLDGFATGGPLLLEEWEGIRITEIFPNPLGADTTEFIELFNATKAPINLSGMVIDDSEDGSRPYRIPEGRVLLPNTLAVFGRQETNIALNNTSDSARLLSPDGTILFEVSYDDVPEAASYAESDSGAFVWTSVVTPGEPNRIAPILGTLGSKESLKRLAASFKKGKVIETTLADIHDQDIGDTVRVIGTVAVLPGVLGSQIFYIVGSGGMQIYLHNKQFPELTIGDVVRVTGRISEARGERRLVVSSGEDMVVFDHADLPPAVLLSIEEIGESYEGSLITIEGEVTEIKSSSLFVDDGTDELRAVIKRSSGLTLDHLQIGSVIRLTGILSESTHGYQLLPRSSADLVVVGAADPHTALLSNGETTPKSAAENYLTTTAAGLSSILIALFAKARGALALQFAKRGGKIALSVAKRWWS